MTSLPIKVAGISFFMDSHIKHGPPTLVVPHIHDIIKEVRVQGQPQCSAPGAVMGFNALLKRTSAVLLGTI